MAVKVAVIGGGPSGAVCGYHLARAGIDVRLYERNPHREKPCGGGLTLRAINGLPFWSKLRIDQTKVNQFRLISPRRRRIDLELTDPIRIASRRDLDNDLRRLAISAGVTLVKETVRNLLPSPGGGWRINGHFADIVVGAGGINDPVARHLGLSFPVRQRGKAFGYFVRGTFPPRIVCRFFPGLWGYAWWFPRPKHASLGIELLGGNFTAHTARSLIKQFVGQDLRHLMPKGKPIHLEKAHAYAWAEPLPDAKVLAKRVFGGRDWLLVGDAAGLVDTLTGEGLPYAFISGTMAAEAILEGGLDAYTHRLKEEILPDLMQAARMSPIFYHALHLRASLFVLAKSKAMQSVTNDMAVGHLRYGGFKRRMLRDAPSIAKDMLYYLSGYFLEKGAFHAR